MNQTSPSSKPWIPYRWELVILLWGTFFLNQADRQILNVVLPLIQTNLGTTDAEMGFIISGIILALAIMAPMAGIAGDRMNRRNMLLFSTICWSLASVLMGVSSWLPILILSRVVATGGGEAFYGPPAFALLGTYHHKSRGLAMGIHQTAIYLGLIGAGTAAGWIGEVYGWQLPFLISGGLGLAMTVLLIWRLQAPPIRSNKDHPLPSVRDTLRVLANSKVAIYLSLSFGGLVFTLIGFLTWMPTFLHEELGLNLAEAGFHATFWHHIAAMIGVLVGGRLSDVLASRRRSARVEMQAIALFAGVPFLMLMAWGSELWIVAIGMAGFGLFRGVYDSNIFAAVYDVIPNTYHASVVGFMTLVAFLAATLAPVLLGAIKGSFGMRPGLSVLALGFLLGGLIVQFLAKPNLKKEYLSPLET
ncbi:MAG: MFS transporter [Bacteroidota bacterium]